MTNKQLIPAHTSNIGKFQFLIIDTQNTINRFYCIYLTLERTLFHL